LLDRVAVKGEGEVSGAGRGVARDRSNVCRADAMTSAMAPA